MNLSNDPKLVVPGPVFPIQSKKGSSLIVNIPDPSITDENLSSGLQLPPLPPPPPNLLMQRKVTFVDTSNKLNALSAVDLKIGETYLEREKNKTNEKIHGMDQSIFKNNWKDMKFDTQMFKHKNSHQRIEYNWNDYNLNSIDKY